MKFSVTTNDAISARCDCLVIAVHDNGRLSASASKTDRASKGLVTRLLKQKDISAKPGSTLMVPAPQEMAASRLLLVGLGDKPDVDDFAAAAAAAARSLCRSPTRKAVITLAEIAVANCDPRARARLVVEALAVAAYRFDQLKSSNNKNDKSGLVRVTLTARTTAATAARRGVGEAQAIANGVHLARDLGNLPGNICTPSYLARRARQLGRSHGLRVSVLDEARMKALKMGALLSVSRGSREPARLIVMEHRGGKRGEAPVVLVGKGLTFDAGGISLKPAASMDEMKYDMCGGASVFGALLAAAELKLPLNVVGIVPSSENLPDGAANKPGDIVTSMSGKTIEILNTDAEGRLILCDALSYAERYKPDTVIDIATLTGACVIALGQPATGLFVNQDGLAKELLAAGDEARDRAWQLPLWKTYQKQLKSPFADIGNIGGRSAGAITAACFLSRFTEGMRWAHLDIAGTAWKSGAGKGATGRPVPLLCRFLINRAGAR